MDLSVLKQADCDQILRNYYHHGDFTLINFELKPFSDEINGYLGEHMLLVIQVVHQGQVRDLTFFVKSLRLHNEIMKESHKKYNIFLKEAFFYFTFETITKEKLNNLDYSFAAKAYLQKDETLVLENLAEKGYVLAAGESFSLEHIRKALEAVSKFHAASLAYEERLAEDGTLFKFSEGYGDVLAEVMLMEGDASWGSMFIKSAIKSISALIDFLPDRIITKEEFKQKFEDETKKFFRVFSEENNFRKVICHGDLWAKNFMFKYKNKSIEDCKMCDFQFLRYVPPAHDITYLIYHNTDKETSRKHFEELLERYYDSLKVELQKFDMDVEKILPMAELKESCRYYLPSTKLLMAFHSTLSMRHEEYESDLFTHQEEFDRFVFGDRSAVVVEQFQKDPAYRALMTELLENIREIILLDLN